MQSINPTQTEAWKALQRHHQAIKSVHLRDLFAADKQRFTQFSGCITDHLLLDYSKNLVTEETLDKLLALAEQTDLPRAIQVMFSGGKINQTEQRAVLHSALRNRMNTPIYVDNQDVMPQINALLAKMKTFCHQVISGSWRGYTGSAITDVVNIGIGGSHLGPLMVTKALTPYKNHLTIHYVANIDASEITETLKRLKPATTLFLIASKTFTTQETLTNAHSVKAWFLAAGGDPAQMHRHFIALSNNAKAVSAFGIDGNNRFDCWEWVGGRYSLWSAMGLSIALSIGFDHFEQLLAGAHTMDQHFAKTPLRHNLPVILALLSLWYSHFWGAQSEAILPYDHYLHHLTAYLQQLHMESNGKSVDRNGLPIHYSTGSIIWGAEGTNGQHAFYQQLHQGTQLIPCDFIGSVNSHNPLGTHHKQLMAHLFAQTQALAFGQKLPKEIPGLITAAGHIDLQPFKRFSGNRPSNTILLRQLTPYTLGLLLALYEHKVFSQGVLLNIFSFDQWGVELGKQLAEQLLPHLTAEQPTTQYDSATNGLINCFKNWQVP